MLKNIFGIIFLSVVEQYWSVRLTTRFDATRHTCLPFICWNFLQLPAFLNARMCKQTKFEKHIHLKSSKNMKFFEIPQIQNGGKKHVPRNYVTPVATKTPRLTWLQKCQEGSMKSKGGREYDKNNKSKLWSENVLMTELNYPAAGVWSFGVIAAPAPCLISTEPIKQSWTHWDKCLTQWVGWTPTHTLTHKFIIPLRSISPMVMMFFLFSLLLIVWSDCLHWDRYNVDGHKSQWHRH